MTDSSQVAAAKAMERASKGVTNTWKRTFIEGTVFALLHSRLITMDDVWAVVDKPDIGDSRASGHLMKGYIVKAGYASLATSCPDCDLPFGDRIALSRDSEDGHGRNLRVWMSHIYNPNCSEVEWNRLVAEIQV